MHTTVGLELRAEADFFISDLPANIKGDVKVWVGIISVRVHF